MAIPYKIVASLIALLVASAPAFSVPLTDPTNPHNMSSNSAIGSVRALPVASGGTDEICIFCHTPHSAAAQTPLWSRQDPIGMGAFPVYGQALVIGQPANRALTGYDAANPDYPSGSSRMCLSCHDGVTSIGVLLDGAPISMEPGSDTITNATAIIDLSTSHPISFRYDAAVIALLNPANYQPPTGAVELPLDSQSRMQCTTCHDPHESTRGLASYGGLPFWRHQGNANSYSEVCGECHTGPTSGTAPPLHNITP